MEIRVEHYKAPFLLHFTIRDYSNLFLKQMYRVIGLAFITVFEWWYVIDLARL